MRPDHGAGAPDGIWCTRAAVPPVGARTRAHVIAEDARTRVRASHEGGMRSSPVFPGFAASVLAILVSGWLIGQPVCAVASTPVEGLRGHLGEPRETGRGTLRFLGMRVYDAVLWTAGVSRPVAGDRAAPPFDRDFALELVYAMELSGARIAERSDQEIGRHPDRGTLAQRARWLERMRAIFPDVRAGDRIVGLYRVDGPTRFLLNDKPLGEIDDPAFGRAFFGIWLDSRTSEPALREALIRGLEPGGSGGGRTALPASGAAAR